MPTTSNNPDDPEDGLSEGARADRREWLLLADEEFRRRVPTDYRDATATEPGVTAWCDTYAHAVIKGGDLPPQWSLLITGSLGAGKTWQAYGAIRRVIAAGIALRWQAASLPDLFDQLRPRPDGDSRAEYEKFADTELLLLDDLGAARDTSWTEEILYRLINHRGMWRRPTIITTNLPATSETLGVPPSLESELSRRVFSRLLRSAEVTMDGPDLRRPRD